jgi:hypothetical protein
MSEAFTTAAPIDKLVAAARSNRSLCEAERDDIVAQWRELREANPGAYIPPARVTGVDGKVYPCHYWIPWPDRDGLGDRIEIAAELRERGLSLRSIGQLIGVSHEQVRRYLSRGNNGTRDTCTGMDGKTYRFQRGEL